MRIRHPVGAFLLTLVAACSPPQPPRPEPDAIPGEVRRRIAQAVWPENLFDSAGQPEPGFVRRYYRPALTDLRVRRAMTPPGLPGVSLFVGEARQSDCSHCGTITYAVAQRGATFLTLLGPDDIADLVNWATPETVSDTVALREFALATLRATCLIGCDVRQVQDRNEVPNADSPFLRGANEQSSSWDMPRTYSWQANGGVLVAFALYAPGMGVYGATFQVDGPDRVLVSISPVARIFMDP